jgi:hypothetical protein
MCGAEVTRSVLRILKREDTPDGINKTFIVLIPKVAQPEELGKFRPISLCNVIYKIASKVLANRPKVILSLSYRRSSRRSSPRWFRGDLSRTTLSQHMSAYTL